MSQGLCMFDSSGRLVMSNDRYRELYGLPPELVRPGCSIRDLLEYRRRIVQFSGDPDEYIAKLQSRTAARGIRAGVRAARWPHHLPDKPSNAHRRLGGNP
jgi:PAS domain-containing protein